MSVETAEAALTLEKAEAAWLTAKASGKKDDKWKKAQAAVIAARDDWRNNHRTPAQAPDASAAPDSVSLSLEVN